MSGEAIQWSDDVKPPSMWPKPSMNEMMTVNQQIMEAVHRKQEELFAAWLAEHDLKDYRKMPFSEQRTEMKHRIFRALYGGGSTEGDSQ